MSRRPSEKVLPSVVVDFIDNLTDTTKSEQRENKTAVTLQKYSKHTAAVNKPSRWALAIRWQSVYLIAV